MQVEIQEVGAIGPPLDRAYPSFDGRFEIRGVPEGQYTIQVKTPLGEPVYRDVVTIHSFDTRLSIKLPPTSKERPVSGLVSVKQLQHKPPKAARMAFDRGVKMFEKGDLARSLASLEEAVAIDPEYVQALNNLGSRYIMLGRLDEAISCLQRASTLDPNAAFIPANLAHAFLIKHQPAAAEPWARRAVALDGNDARNPYLLGIAAGEEYPALFEKAFGDGQVSADRIAGALAQFVRSLVSYRSKYDKGLANTGSVADARKAFSSCLQSTDAPVRDEAQRMLSRLAAR